MRSTEIIICPSDMVTVEQATNFNMNKFGAMFYEKFTDPTVVDNIKVWLQTKGVAVTDNIDTFILYITNKVGVLTEFSKGCSREFSLMDVGGTVEFLQKFGM